MAIIGTGQAHMLARLLGLATNFLLLVYLGKRLPIDEFALVGVYTTLNALTVFVDLGVPGTAARHLAMRLGRGISKEAAASIARSLEAVSWCLASLCFLAVFATARPIGVYWLAPAAAHADVVVDALRIAALPLAIRLPTVLYGQLNFAIERHFSSNLIIGTSALMRLGTIPIAVQLFGYSASSVFIGYGVVGIIECLALAACFWRNFQSSFWTMPSVAVYREIRAYSLNNAILICLQIASAQIDKVTASRFISLSQFGVYALASSLTVSLASVGQTMSNVLLPRFSRLRPEQDIAEILLTFRYGVHLITAALLPPLVAVALQADKIVTILFPALSANTGLAALLLPLAATAGLQALAVVPNTLILALGHPGRLGMATLLAMILGIPVLIAGVWLHGALGAATAAAVAAAIQLILSAMLATAWLPTTFVVRCIVVEPAAALVVSVAIVVGLGSLSFEIASTMEIAIILVGSTIMAQMALLAASPLARRELRARIPCGFLGRLRSGKALLASMRGPRDPVD